MAIDIFQLVFQDILQISSNLINQYPTVQDQLLYLILIPHVVLLLFIVAFSRGIVGRIVGEHPGFQYLFAIVSYLFFILSGWYGTLLVPLLITWFYIAILLAIFVFLVGIVFSPSRAPAVFKTAAVAGQMVGEKTIGRTKKKQALQKEIDKIDDQITGLNQRLAQTPPGHAQTYITMKISELETKKTALEHERDNL